MAAAGRGQADVALRCGCLRVKLFSLELEGVVGPSSAAGIPQGYGGQWAGPGLGRGLPSHPSSVTPRSGPWVPPAEGASQAPMGSGVRTELGCGC